MRFALCNFFSFLFLFPFLPQPIATPRHGKFASCSNVLLVGRAKRSEKSVLHPVQNAHASFVPRVKKKPFSTCLLVSLFFSYFSTKLGAFALREQSAHSAMATRLPRIARGSIRASARAMRDFIIPQFFIHLFFNVCTP